MQAELTEKQQHVRNILGKNLTYYRKAQGWTIERLATETGYSPSWIGGVERGTMNSSTDRLVRISDYLGVDIYILFFNRSSETANP